MVVNTGRPSQVSICRLPYLHNPIRVRVVTILVVFHMWPDTEVENGHFRDEITGLVRQSSVSSFDLYWSYAPQPSQVDRVSVYDKMAANRGRENESSARQYPMEYRYIITRGHCAVSLS